MGWWQNLKAYFSLAPAPEFDPSEWHIDPEVTEDNEYAEVPHQIISGLVLEAGRHQAILKPGATFRVSEGDLASIRFHFAQTPDPYAMRTVEELLGR